MDWLSKHNARIDTKKKEIKIQSGMRSLVLRDPIMEKKEIKTKLVGAVEMVKIIEREDLLELNRCFLVRVISLLLKEKCLILLRLKRAQCLRSRACTA